MLVRSKSRVIGFFNLINRPSIQVRSFSSTSKTIKKMNEDGKSKDKKDKGWKWDPEVKAYYRGMKLSEIAHTIPRAEPAFVDEEKDMITYIPIAKMTTREVTVDSSEENTVPAEPQFAWEKLVESLKDLVPVLNEFNKDLGEDAKDLLECFEYAVSAKKNNECLRGLGRGMLQQLVDAVSQWPHSVKTANEKINELSNNEYKVKIKTAIDTFNIGIKQFCNELNKAEQNSISNSSKKTFKK